MSLGSIIYKNLAAEMARKSLSRKDIAGVLCMSTAAVNLKLAGKTQITLNEAFKIRDALFPTLLLDYLFDIKPRYDLIDIFRFPDKREYSNDSENKGHDPNDCA